MQKRAALVIGNANYVGPNTTKLRNPVKDASSIARKLRKYGFELTCVTDGTNADMRASLAAFQGMIEADGVALVFFAGHGIQIDGENFLFSCDTDASGENQAKYSSLSLNQIIDVLDRSKAETKIIILDACRENPFEAAWHRSGATRGLASVFAPRGTIIAYATSPGQIALEGRSGNGVYTGALLQHIDTPDCPIETVFKRVRNAVAAETAGKQITWEHTSLAGDFYFKGNMFNEAFELQKFHQFKDSFDFIADTLIGAHGNFYVVPGKGHTLSVSVVTEKDKRGRRITGVFIDTVNVFTLRDAEYAEDEEKPTFTRGLTKEDFDAQLAKDLVVPRRLLEVRYSPSLERGDVLRYPYGWGVSKQ